MAASYTEPMVDDDSHRSKCGNIGVLLLSSVVATSKETAIDGHPIAIGAAIHSLRKWTFRPYTVSREPKSVVGLLSVPYDFAS